MKKLISAFALAAIALFMLSGYLTSNLDKSRGASLAALLLVVALPAIGSFLLFRSHYQEKSQVGSRKNQLREQVIESEVLKLAAAKGGKLTAIEVAMALSMSPEAGAEALDRLALRGQASYEVTEAGVIVYSFYDILHLGSKDSAKGVLDA